MHRLPTCTLALALAACSGGTRATPTDEPRAAGEPVAPDALAGPSAAEQARARRAAFANPGGMWMPRQMIDHAARLRELGLEVDAAALADPTAAPLSAVVSLGGCTGSFVSAEGLIITNHHCVQSALQLNSTPEANLVETGFVAATRADEKPAGPSQRVYVAQKMTDVTAQMLEGLSAIAEPRDRGREVEAREKALVSACEQDRPAVKCRVSSFFAASEWQLIEYLELRDVRLVYVPHRAIGNYGGEIDNWAWPRHTGDFAFLRAYVGPDGQPADPSPDNVPFQPPAHLELSVEGVAADDLVFVAGYPGRTSRLQTAAEATRMATWTYPRNIEKARLRMAVLERLQQAGGETAIKAGVLRQSVQNVLEKQEGILDTVARGDLLANKAADEAALRTWAAADASRARYLDALDRLTALLADTWAFEDEHEAWRDAVNASSLLAEAVFLVRWVHEQQQPDAERKPGFQARDRSLVEAKQRTFTRKFDRTIDRALWELMLTRAAAEPAAASWLRPMLGLGKRGKLDARAIDQALDRIYRGTQLDDEAARLALLDATPAALGRSKDPFVRLAVALYPLVEALVAREEADKGEALLVAPVYAEGLLAFRGGGGVAPDANSTLRVSFGIVRGYQLPGGEPYTPFTTAPQIVEKHTGAEPFDAPAALREQIATAAWGPYAAAALGVVPVDFLSDVDTTGGNSGSPILDARGRLVGLHFDRNKEGVASEVYFLAETTRSIATDIRYVLWVADAVDQADHVLRELGIEPAL